jgi:site-specific recombinase XerD
MASRPATPITVDAYFRTLRHFYNWLVIEEYIDRSPRATMIRPRVVADQPDPFSEEELAVKSCRTATAP